MKVTYNSKLNAYQVIYKDTLAELSGERPYARKQFTAGKKKPTAAERKARIRELETWATEQEEKSRLAAEAKLRGNTTTDTHNGETPILAVDYIENLKGDNLTTTRKVEQVKTAIRHCKDFVLFLKEKHAGIYLHKINRKIALEFANWMTEQGRSYAYKKGRWVRLGYVFNRVLVNNEDSELPYRNPFWALKIEDVAEEEPVIHKKTFTPEIVKLLLDEAKTTTHTKGAKKNKNFIFQRYAILYIMAITGIRPKDIMLLKWEQLDIKNRTLTITHNKTKRKGIKTVLWLTPHLLELFVTLQEMHQNNKVCSKEYVFSFNPMRHVKVVKDMGEYLYISTKNELTNFFIEWRKKHGLTQYVEYPQKKVMCYSMYSLRATVGTLLSNAQFNDNNIDYLQGHAPNNTTSRFYLDRESDPKASTASMIDYLAYRVAQQPLGKFGMKVAYQDALEEKRKQQKQAEISEDIRYTNDGTTLLTNMLLDKADAERQAKETLVELYGEDVANTLTQDNSPQQNTPIQITRKGVSISYSFSFVPTRK